MSNDELDRLEGLAEIARGGTRMGASQTKERFEAITEVCQKAPALVAEVRRLREANASAYKRGFDFGTEHLSRALEAP